MLNKNNYYKNNKILPNNFKKFNTSFIFTFKSLFPFLPKVIKSSINGLETVNNRIYTKEILVFKALLEAFLEKKDKPDFIRYNKNKELIDYKLFDTLFFKNVNINKIKEGFLIKKRVKKKTFIRAPYRNKISQIHISKKEFIISISLNFDILFSIRDKNSLYNEDLIFSVLLFFFNSFNYYQSNHLVQWSKETKISYNFFL